jgi:hypothetical protein
MENKQSTHSKPKARHTSLLGTLFFTLFNLILLSLLSWTLLEMWFSVQGILLSSANSSYTIQKILYSDFIIIKHFCPHSSDVLLHLFQYVRDLIYYFNYFIKGPINKDVIEIFLNVTEIIVIRIFLFIQFVPFMMVVLCVFIMDGLVLRDKRKFQGARESTFLFHRLKRLSKLSFFSLFFIYMVSPYAISPRLFLMLMTLVSGLFFLLSIKHFKKYL